MKFRTVVLAHVPLLLQARWNFIFVVNLVDGDPLICQIQHLIVQVGIGIPLRAHDLLNALVTPAWPVMGGNHYLRLHAIAV